MGRGNFRISPKGDVANVAVSGGGKVAVGDLNTFETSAQIAPLGQPDGMWWMT
jgi:hypothetical protein